MNKFKKILSPRNDSVDNDDPSVISVSADEQKARHIECLCRGIQVFGTVAAHEYGRTASNRLCFDGGDRAGDFDFDVVELGRQSFVRVRNRVFSEQKGTLLTESESEACFRRSVGGGGDADQPAAAASPSAGKSGASFWPTPDGMFLIKSIRPAEARQFANVLAPFFAHTRHGAGDSLLNRAVGLYRVESADCAPTNFVVLENLFRIDSSSNIDLVCILDLKGSLHGRSVVSQGSDTLSMPASVAAGVRRLSSKLAVFMSGGGNNNNTNNNTNMNSNTDDGNVVEDSSEQQGTEETRRRRESPAWLAAQQVQAAAKEEAERELKSAQILSISTSAGGASSAGSLHDDWALIHNDAGQSSDDDAFEALQLTGSRFSVDKDDFNSDFDDDDDDDDDAVGGHADQYTKLYPDLTSTSNIVNNNDNDKEVAAAAAAASSTSNPASLIFKDLDVLAESLAGHRPLPLTATGSGRLLLQQLAKDCEFLARHQLMDFSLLVGVGNLTPITAGSKQQQAGAGTSSYRRPRCARCLSRMATAYFSTHLSQKQPLCTPCVDQQTLAFADQASKSASPGEEFLPPPPAALDVSATDGPSRNILLSPFRSFHGGLKTDDGADDSDGSGSRAVLYCGLIDYFQPFDVRKRLERAARSTLLQQPRDLISCAEPEEYGRRLIHFVSSIIHDEPNSIVEQFSIP